MEPSLITGDHVLVTKLIPGARLFNIFASMNNEQVTIYRTPGIRKIKRNDIIVYHFVHSRTWDKIEMHIMQYHIKRCIGLPGDTVVIQNGVYSVKGIDAPLGNRDSQHYVSEQDNSELPDEVFNTFPYDSIIGWNIKNFGPFYIPKKGDRIVMNRTNYILYKKAIEFEQKTHLEYRDSFVYLNNKPINEYLFQKNYYFTAGDRTEDSQDSRYWGLLPEEYIVGKAWIIWKSVDPYTDKFRWDRFLKRIK